MDEGSPKRKTQEQIEDEFEEINTLVTGLVYFLYAMTEFGENSEFKALALSWVSLKREVHGKKVITEKNLSKLKEILTSMTLFSLRNGFTHKEISHERLKEYVDILVSDVDIDEKIEERGLTEKNLRDILKGSTRKRKPN